MATTSPLLERAETILALSPDPRGKYFVGRTWLSFFAKHGGFSGTIVWGTPSPEDVEVWTACADLRVSEACSPHATLFDASKIERLSPSVFAALSQYMTRSLAELESRITRVAVVHRGEFAGAIAVGFTTLAPISFPAQIFQDAQAALAWLGCADDAPLLEELGRVRLEARSVPAIVRELGTFLEHHPRAAPVEAARAMALSTRSLQRRLREHDTTFRKELDVARVRLAQRRLRDSDVSITAVALEVGLTSPQHLSTLFHRCGFEAPSVWRARGKESTS